MFNWLVGLSIFSYVIWVVYYQIKGWLYGSNKCSACSVKQKCNDLKNKY